MKEKPQFDALQKGLGYKFKDPSLLVRCLTHVSYSYDRTPGHNEVLEFLGDAVLDLAVSDLLMRQFPEKSEGDLSRMRAALVNSSVLAGKAMAINFGPLLRLGKGEERSGGRHKESILAGASSTAQSTREARHIRRLSTLDSRRSSICATIPAVTPGR